MEFSKPLEHFGVWKIDVPDDVFPVKHELATSYFYTDEYQQLVQEGVTLDGCRRLEGNHIGFFAEFPSLQAGEKVVVKSGISFVSSEGATQDQKCIFYTAMYHAMIDPRAISDVDGNYTGADGKVHAAAEYTPRTVFSGWDVFRGEFPLMTLLNATMVNDEINSLVNLAETSGKGYLERWELLSAYTGCMDGDPATSVILDAYSKGIRGFDVEKAYAVCRQTAAGKNGTTNRPENAFYMEHGYVPNGDLSPGVSWTLDNAYFDWCVGRLASALGKTEDARFFSDRASNYKKIYDPSVGFMCANNSAGEWIPWRGETAFGQGCTESNPIQQTWFVPHDVAGLIALMGGKEEFTRKLDDFFEKTPPTFGWNDHCNHSNEPVHHVPYWFVYAGKPWLTQKWVRRVLNGAYRNNVNGICGNDDLGQMSAWYVLGALGFYPVCPGDGIYILGSPLFSRATIHLDEKWYKGAKFTITAENLATDHLYVQSARLNGSALPRAWIRHGEIAAGGLLEFTMGPNPNKQWVTRSIDLPPSMSSSPTEV